MNAVIFALGIFLLTLAFWDLFETVIVPRPTPGWFRIARYVVRGSWRGLRFIVNGRRGPSRDRILGLFAPAMSVALLGSWLVTLILGYGLILFALRDELRPVPPDLGTAVYFAATSILTLGFGDIVADGMLARFFIVTAAVGGLGAVALVVTFLFSLFGSYQRREVEVVALQAAAGAPPSAVALPRELRPARPPESTARTCSSMAALGRRGPRLTRRLSVARLLSVEPRQPVVDQRAGIGARCREPRAHDHRGRSPEAKPSCSSGWARTWSRTSSTSASTGACHRSWIASQFDLVCDRLEEAGYVLAPRDTAWPAFEGARATYAARLEAMALYWATPATSWLGDPVALRAPVHPPNDP